MERFKKSIGNYAMEIDGVKTVITGSINLHILTKYTEYVFDWDKLEEFYETYGMETTKRRLKEKIMEEEN